MNSGVLPKLYGVLTHMSYVCHHCPNIYVEEIEKREIHLKEKKVEYELWSDLSVSKIKFLFTPNFKIHLEKGTYVSYSHVKLLLITCQWNGKKLKQVKPLISLSKMEQCVEKPF